MTNAVTRREAMAVLGALALPVPATGATTVAQSPPSAAPSPDLGNVHDLLASIARANAPRLTFLDASWKTLDDWKRAARAEFQARLLYEPPAKTLGAQVVKREDRDGFTLETLRISATDAYDIPAWALVPKGRSGRLPAVLALHCHGGMYVWGGDRLFSQPGEAPVLTTYRERLYGRPYAEFLARRGYLVLVIDAFYFGARRLRVEELDPSTAPGEMKDDLRRLGELNRTTPEWVAAANSLSGRYEHLTAKSLFTVGTTWPGILTWDDKRSVDYLTSRADVDPTRIGCVGLSLGGLRSARLVAADPRIKVACVTGFMTEFLPQLRNHIKSHTWMAYTPGLYASLDLPDLAALLAPGALLVQQCSRDALFPMAGMKGSADKIARVYAKAGIAERFRASFHDQPHSLFAEMQDEAFDWFDRWL